MCRGASCLGLLRLALDGGAIPRLYKCGELGSIYGQRYSGGGNIAELLAVGRIAGRNAAAA
jgi:3-oxosteroid 1-dehydrogenase